MTSEIFYCARCRRVILPREISEGRYHIVDGDSVCTECFTRLSRRLRAMGTAVDKPRPVDISNIPAAEPPPEPAAKAVAAEPPPPRASVGPVTSRRSAPAVSRGKMLVPAGFLLLGLLAGAAAYLVLRPRTEVAAAPLPVPAPANPPR